MFIFIPLLVNIFLIFTNFHASPQLDVTFGPYALVNG